MLTSINQRSSRKMYQLITLARLSILSEVEPPTIVGESKHTETGQNRRMLIFRPTTFVQRSNWWPRLVRCLMSSLAFSYRCSDRLFICYLIKHVLLARTQTGISASMYRANMRTIKIMSTKTQWNPN